MNIFFWNKSSYLVLWSRRSGFFVQKMKINIKAWPTAKWINAQFVSISTGRDFQPRWFMINLCRSSDPMQSYTRRWPPTLARLAAGLRTKSSILTPLPMLSTTQFSKPSIKPRSRQCMNSKSQCVFHVQQFGDVWLGPLDFLSSIYNGIAIRLTDAQWQIQIDWSNELLKLLKSSQTNNWQNSMTLNES
jgi:hypothetical protein